MKVFKPVFLDTGLDCKGFNMVYHSIQSDDYLSYLILRGKQKAKKTKAPEYEVRLHFQWSEQ